MDNAKKIAIIGTHGIGKSTLAYNLATFFKELSFNCCVINEVVRDCPFPINDNFGLEGAHWIITTQIQRELQAIASKYNMIICDRSSIDPIMYLKAKYVHGHKYTSLERYAEDWLNTYDSIIFIVPSEEELVDDGVRHLEKRFQMNVHKFFYTWVQELTYVFLKQKIFIVDSTDIMKKNFTHIYKEILGT